MPRMVICRECNKEKPHEAHGLCRNCYMRKWHADNQEEETEKNRTRYKQDRERRLKKVKKQYAKNPDKYIERHLKNKYNITLAEYDEILDAQGGGCAICGKTPEENGKRLAVDHDHETGENRELLCYTCNMLLGYAQDDPELCRRAMLYLKNHGR